MFARFVVVVGRGRVVVVIVVVVIGGVGSGGGGVSGTCDEGWCDGVEYTDGYHHGGSKKCDNQKEASEVIVNAITMPLWACQ